MSQQFVSGSMAAQAIGMSYKTLKVRYDEGWIVGERTPQGKLRFTLDEVERARKVWEEERSQFITTPQLFDLLEPARKELLFQEPSRSSLEAEISELKEEVEILKGRVALLEQSHVAFPQAINPTPIKPYDYKVINAKTKSNLPEGYVLASKFAEEHNVKRSTFRGHVEEGIGPYKEKIKTTERPKPGRPHQIERLLSPEEQTMAIDFWDRYGISHR